MRRLIAFAIWVLLAAPLVAAQIHGVPPSVTSQSPGQRISAAPPASVTSLGPFGWQVGANFRHGSGFNRTFRPRFDGRHGSRFDGKFRHHGRNFFWGSSWGSTFVPSVVYPIFDGYYDDDPASAAMTSYPPAGYPQQPALPSQIEVHVVHEQAPPPSPATPSTPAAAPVPPREQAATILVFHDGHKLEVHNYAIVGDQLYNFSSSGPRKIGLAELDLEGTRKVNEDNGVEFRPPVVQHGS